MLSDNALVCRFSTNSYPWDGIFKLDQVTNHRSGRDLNTLVMNYLIIEGYKSAAVNFAQEANMSAQVDLDSIQERVDIRRAIHHGDIQTAIERINELHPEVGGIFLFNFKPLVSCFIYIYIHIYIAMITFRVPAAPFG